MLGKAIHARLFADTDVKDIVDDRIFSHLSKENVYPLIVYEIQQENEPSIQSLNGKEFTVTLMMITGGLNAKEPYSKVRELDAAVKASLDRQQGTWGGIEVKGAFFQGSSETAYAEGTNPESLFFEIEHTYKFWARA